MDAEWENSPTPGWLRRAAKPFALVVAGILAGAVALPSTPTTPEPTFSVDAEPPAAPVARLVESARRRAPGTWTPMAAGPLSARADVVSAWTGQELVVWGGRARGGRFLADGAAYDPDSDSWRRLPSAPLRARAGATGVWTGTELVVWGGAGTLRAGRRVRTFADGAAYNPRTNRWRRLPAAPLTARRESVGVWAGREVVVWGGRRARRVAHETDGARYDPKTRRWRHIGGGPLAGRRSDELRGVALDGRVLLWSSSRTETAEALYDPAAGDWHRVEPARVEPGTPPALATVAGAVLLWSRWSVGDHRPLAARYTTATRRWTRVEQPPRAPLPGQSLVAAGSAAVAWQPGGGLLLDGISGRWRELGAGPSVPRDALTVWTGTRLLVWSPGTPPAGTRGTAWVRGNPWRRVPAAPAAIDAAGTAVWTGWLQGDQQVVMWGGLDSGAANVGAAYDPELGLWEALPTAPLTRRVRPAGVWTGRELVVLGGSDLAGAPPLRDAAAFGPGTRRWRRLPDAPFGVGSDAAAWSGSTLYAGGLRRRQVAVAEYDEQASAWRLLPPPPLAPGEHPGQVLLAWTDFELWVWSTRVGATGSGAAWDPDRRRWRRLPELPGVQGLLSFTWAVNRIYVVSERGATASLGRGGDVWRRYPRSPVRGPTAALEWKNQVLLAFDAQRRRLAALDPGTATWTREMAPPVPAAVDGRLVWTGRDMFALAGGVAAVLAR